MERTVLVNARVVPGDGPPIPCATVVIDGERIGAVSTQSVVERSGDRVIDLAGRTVMPGMITCHAHLGYTRLGTNWAIPPGLEATPAYLVLQGAKNMELLLDSGFTGAVSAGNGLAMDAALKRAADHGLILGPRLMAGSRNLGPTGFSLDMSHPWHWGISEPVDIRVCDGADEFRKGVRQEIKQGAEIIKLFTTGGHLSVTPEEQFEMCREEIVAAIDAAHGHRAKIRAHASNVEAILEAVELGIDVIDHGDGLDDECIAAMVERGVFLVPSLRLPLIAVARAPGYRPAAVAGAEAERMKAKVVQAHEAGVKIVLGDDYGVINLDHGTEAEELAFYVHEIGVPALDVIKWATLHGAELMGRAHELGTVEVGKLADLLVVDGDPVSDIDLLSDRRKLLAIVRGGVFMKDEMVVSTSIDNTAQRPRITSAYAVAPSEPGAG